MYEQHALRVMRTMVDAGQLTDPESARGKLLQTASHLFRNKGFERTTVRDLASAVGIQSGSIFHHFKSKDEILRAVMEETIHYNTAMMRASLAEASNVRERVLALIRCELQSIMGGSGEAMAVLVYEWRSLSAEGQAQVLALLAVAAGTSRVQALGEASLEARDQGRCVYYPALPHRRLVLDPHLVSCPGQHDPGATGRRSLADGVES